jgi:probable F420-dependent oxidoreductase
MKFGAFFPSYEIEDDPSAIRDFAQGVEGMGFDHIMFIDHVLGVSEDDYPDIHGPYRFFHPFHEVFTTMAYLAGVTERVEFFTSVLVLPQRQTVMVAKQAAQVDFLSGGRLRLGVGVGWHELEFDGLNENFKNRGPRIEEQIAVMRALWTEEIVDFDGEWHTIRKAGINPMPVQRPIPIWFGGEHPKVLRRLARMGDGWMPRKRLFGGWDPNVPQDIEIPDIIGRMHDACAAEGRDPATIGIEQMTRFNMSDNAEDWLEHGRELKAHGGTHFSIHTLDAGLKTVDEHLAVMRRFKDAMADL